MDNVEGREVFSVFFLFTHRVNYALRVINNYALLLSLFVCEFVWVSDLNKLKLRILNFTLHFLHLFLSVENIYFGRILTFAIASVLRVLNKVHTQLFYSKAKSYSFFLPLSQKN